MTPLQLTMLLHYHAVVAPYAEHEPQHAHSIAVSCQRAQLISLGLLVTADTPSGYEVTDKGRVFIDALCKLPMPVQVWAMP